MAKRSKRPRLSFDELKIQIALGTIPPEYIKAQVSDPEILDKLANLPDEKIRMAVAAHPNTKTETLMRLVEDPNACVDLLILLAANPKIPIEVLHKLAAYKTPRVSEEAKGVLFI